MEDTLQKVFAILLSVVVFFLLPLYMAFEKKDDIAYSMALRITSNFVDNVTNKGYITENMYNNFISDLALTGNSYEVTMQHKAKKYYPVIYASKKNADNTIEYDYNLNKDKYKSYLEGNDINDLEVGHVYNKNSDNTLTLNYKLDEILYTENQILGTVGKTLQTAELTYFDSDGKIYYPMNKGDEFTVVIKNTNTTIASILFNTLTMGVNEETPKVYINYGGAIQNESYRKTALIAESTNVEDTYISDEDISHTLRCSIVRKSNHSVETVYGDINLDRIVDAKDKDMLKDMKDNSTAYSDLKYRINKDNAMVTGSDLWNAEANLTALDKYVNNNRPYLLKQSTNGKNTYTWYIVFSEDVKLKDNDIQKAVTVVESDLNFTNQNLVNIKSLKPDNNNDKVWELKLECKNKNDVLNIIKVNRGAFVAINDMSKVNLASEAIYLHLDKDT